ncbi:phage neck terminator protein [Pseudomonas chlororaphis]|uniref:phage neck terminator protein n=1 Tax=Pseudomonas chlororaphis TaxID=587753 RepID=UPI0015E005A3|nr:hypothetical protein [Pseudomonas chlororaphis]QLL11704.1 hypothetical protein H0I86_22120 [Pseudomonas chlororaphis subsp. aurantiaca]
MANTSATGGYLAPAGSPAPSEDDQLEDILQAMVVGISGLPGPMVRPRWQPNPPKQPEPNINWCAVGVHETKTVANPAISHVGAGDGSDEYQMHEELSVLCTFYGPQAQAYASILRDGIFIPQNSEAIKSSRMAFVGASDIRPVPELVNQQWVRRYDLFIQMRRQVVRVYPVLNILSAEPTIVD